MMLINRCGNEHILFFFFNDTSTTEIYPLSLHYALPISPRARPRTSRIQTPSRCPTSHPIKVAVARVPATAPGEVAKTHHLLGDRKSTRLNSSHANISYAVFCLKKKI